MFGYIYVNEQELKLRELAVYRSYYCGLCEELHRRYGRAAQMVLNYDMTFLALLLTGLYEPETATEKKRCLIHPVHRHAMASNDAIRYSADMSVLLAYQKALDDWKDEKKMSGRMLAGMLHSGCRQIAAHYPRQTAAVEKNIRLLHKYEQRRLSAAADQPASSGEGGGSTVLSGNGRLSEIDYTSGLTGNFLGELFVWKEDIWQEELRRIGFYLGKFIYLMDALEDIDKDRKKGNYNVFSGMSSVWEERSEEQIRRMLAGMMTEASRAFERLPVLENAGILRNILYSGVWCKYTAQREKHA